MANSDLSNYIANRFNDVVISGHAIAVRLRRDVVGPTPQQIRSAIEGVSRLNPGHFRGSLDYEEIGGVKCGISRYKERTGPKVLWIHGGAFSFGSARVYKATAIYLARYFTCEVVMPEYRLSPEHKYPMPFEDCLNVYKELTANVDDVFLIGDSSGGNIAAHLTQNCIANNLPIPKKLVLLSPWLDLRPNSVSNTTNYSEYSPFDNQDTVAFSKDYIGKIDPSDPRVSPLNGSFEGFPETHIQASKVEFLFNDTKLCIDALENAGVNYSAHFEEKAVHGWHIVPDFLPEASRSMTKVVEFLKG